MDKDKSRVAITATAGQISQAADRIMARWPKDDVSRPEKLAILNDFAASVRPGTNWGGLVEKCRGAAKDSHSEAESAARLRKIVANVKSLSGTATAVGARVTEFADAQGLLDSPSMLTSQVADACLDLPGGGNLVGVCLRVFETQSWAQFEIDPVLVIEESGEVVTMNVDIHDTPAALLAALYRIMERASQLQWWSFLQSHGLSQAYLVFGPAHCVGLIPWGAFDLLSKGKPIDRHHRDAVLLIADPASDAPDHRTDIIKMAGLVARILPDLTYHWSEGADGPFRLELDLREPIKTNQGDPLADLPTELPTHGFLARTSSRSKWITSHSDKAVSLPLHLDHGLGEALHFALKAIGLSDERSLILYARVNRSRPGKAFSGFISDDWQVLILHDGALRSWSVAEPEAQKSFRRNFEAWIKVESNITVLPDRSMPKGSVDVIVQQPSYLNTTHWDRARVLFGLVS